MLNDIDHYKGDITTRYALKIAPLVFVSPSELRVAKWADAGFKKRVWQYTPPKTRKQTGLGLLVPLSTQLDACLQESK